MEGNLHPGRQIPIMQPLLWWVERGGNLFEKFQRGHPQQSIKLVRIFYQRYATLSRDPPLSFEQGGKRRRRTPSSFLPISIKNDTRFKVENGKVSTKRHFDQYTISIWAKNMVQRGGSTQEALRLLMNRMDSGRARHTTVLYNTALDICGHKGMLLEAGQIFHQMVAKNVRANDRTITSLLNCIAEHSIGLPFADKNYYTNSLLSPQSGDTMELKDSELPGLAAFRIVNKREAAELAIKLYSSWIEYSKATLHPFNALLKVLWRTGSGDLLSFIFPVNNSKGENQNDDYSSGVVWMPPKTDVVSYTTAILACQFNLAQTFPTVINYWKAFLHSKIPIDSGIISAILSVLHRELCNSKVRLPRVSLESRRGILLEVGGILSDQLEKVPVKTSNLFLNVALGLGCYELGLKYWNLKLYPILVNNSSMVKSKGSINEETILLLFSHYMKVGNASEVLNAFEMFQRRFGMHVSTRLLNLTLASCRRLNDSRVQVQRLFETFCKKFRTVTPDSETLYQLLLATSENTSLTRSSSSGSSSSDLANYTRITIDWFSKKHPDIIREIKTDPSRRKILDRIRRAYNSDGYNSNSNSSATSSNSNTGSNKEE